MKPKEPLRIPADFDNQPPDLLVEAICKIGADADVILKGSEILLFGFRRKTAGFTAPE